MTDVAQRLRRPQPRQRRTDDHDAGIGGKTAVNVPHGEVGEIVDVDQDRADGARRSRPQHVHPHRLVGLRHVHQRLVADEAEDIRSEERALRVALAQREINGEPHGRRW